ncbi:MAG: FAD:protein FMN transferase [Anaerolineales bacterium]|nr:FAD:protein FMN transferase [Anaerolineales bacterium]
MDRAADLLYRSGPFIVNAGGDLYAYGHPDNGAGWCVDIEHPFEPHQSVATVRVDHHAMATSSIGKRRWSHAGAIQHHLIDPRTGRPATTDALSVTIVAPRTALAEVYAKAVLLLGVEAGLDFLRNLQDIDALIYTSRGNVVCTEGFSALLTKSEGLYDHG